jgi:hypothetical protein
MKSSESRNGYWRLRSETHEEESGQFPFYNILFLKEKKIFQYFIDREKKTGANCYVIFFSLFIYIRKEYKKCNIKQ